MAVVTAKENRWVEYTTRRGDQRVDVRIDLERTPRASVRASDGETWEWSA